MRTLFQSMSLRTMAIALGICVLSPLAVAMASQNGQYDEVTSINNQGIVNVSATTPIYVKVTTPGPCDYGAFKLTALTCSSQVNILANANINVEFNLGQMSDVNSHVLRHFINVQKQGDSTGVGCATSEGGSAPAGMYCMDPDIAGIGLVDYSQSPDVGEVTYTLSGFVDHPLRWPSLFGSSPIVKSGAYSSTITIAITPGPSN